MGRLYRDGNKQQGFVVEANPKQAFDYFKMAADQGASRISRQNLYSSLTLNCLAGFVDAIFQIGLAYHNGSGIPKSIDTALEWYIQWHLWTDLLINPDKFLHLFTKKYL